jgi:hypothetical protein
MLLVLHEYKSEQRLLKLSFRKTYKTYYISISFADIFTIFLYPHYILRTPRFRESMLWIISLVKHSISKSSKQEEYKKLETLSFQSIWKWHSSLCKQISPAVAFIMTEHLLIMPEGKTTKANLHSVYGVLDLFLRTHQDKVLQSLPNCGSTCPIAMAWLPWGSLPGGP